MPPLSRANSRASRASCVRPYPCIPTACRSTFAGGHITQHETAAFMRDLLKQLCGLSRVIWNPGSKHKGMAIHELEVMRPQFDDRTDLKAASDTDREFRASFERQGRASPGRELGASVVGALIHPARRATFSRGVDRCNMLWRDGVSPVSSAARTRPVRRPSRAGPPPSRLPQATVLNTTG